MKAGIVGFRRVGKTTIFNAMTGLGAKVGGYGAEGGGAIKPNLGVIKVPDPRLDYLASVYRPRKLTPAEVRLVDVPGREGSESALDQKTIAEMRDVDALVQIVGDFGAGSGYDHSTVNKQLEEFHAELVLADLAIVEKRRERLRKEGSRGREALLLGDLQPELESGRALRDLQLRVEQLSLLSGFNLLSQMPLLLLVNVDEARLGAKPADEVREWGTERGLEVLSMCGKMEMEIAQLEESERAAFAAELGIETLARDQFLRAVYRLLDLVSFLTVGPDEVKAWTIPRNSKAVDAARKIHTDIARGFIRAEVVSYEDFVTYGGESGCREAGKLKVEGKESKIRDGDIVHFRFNV